MDIKPSSQRAAQRGPTDYFTGNTWIEQIADASVPNSAKSVLVSFEPAARTAWHTHPLGQTLYVVSGHGRAQVWGGPVVAIKPGDTVWFPPGEKHWHGAAPHHTMTHFAVQEAKDGVTVTWLEHVSEADYSVEPC